MDKTDYWFNLELLVYWLLEDSTYLPDIGWTATDEDGSSSDTPNWSNFLTNNTIRSLLQLICDLI